MLFTTLVFSFLLVGGQEAAVPGDELTTAWNNLKAAEQKKDTGLIKKWSQETSTLARAEIKTLAAEKADSAVHKSRIEFARQLESYADYAIYSAALRASDAKERIDWFETLNQQSPGGEYTSQLYGVYAGALTQLGQTTKLYQFADKAILKDPNNEDLLTIVADGALNRKQFDRAATYGAKLAAVMSNHPVPKGTPAGDWERRQAMMMGRGYWIAGMGYANQGKYPQADKNFRASLPYVKDDDQMRAGALFFLGVANYNMSRATQNKALLREAVEFSTQAASIKSPYQQQASQNVWAMKGELTRMR